MKVGGFEYPPPDIEIAPDNIVRVLRSDCLDLALHPPGGVLNREFDEFGAPAREVVIDGAARRAGAGQYLAGSHALQTPLGDQYPSSLDHGVAHALRHLSILPPTATGGAPPAD